MKIKLNIKSIIFMTIIALASLLFINISFAANTGKVLVETAKLREQANTDSRVLELASQGEEVEILNEEDQWYKVKYKQVTGYIRKDLIELDNKEAASTKNKNEQTKEDTQNTTENTVENTSENVQTEENKIVENTTTDTNKEENEEEIVKNQKYKITEDVKIKVIPLISSIELDNVKKDEEVEVVEILNDWVKIKTSNEQEGWIRKEKLTTIKEKIANTENTTETTADSSKVETSSNETQTSTDTNTEKTEQTNTTKTMYVNSQSVNLRQKADKTSQVIKSLTLNTKVTVLSSTNGWAYVDVNGTKGYVAENLLTSTQKETSRSGLTTREQASSNTTNTASSNNASTSSSTANVANKTETTTSSKSGSSVVSYAKQFLGCKYVYGGTSPSGFDCSGFTQYVYKHFGINLNRTAAAQYSNGKSVTSLQAGDLVMFGKSGINHVGIYIGGNTFIHAANKSQGVRTDSMSTGYYKTNYVGARRIF